MHEILHVYAVLGVHSQTQVYKFSAFDGNAISEMGWKHDLLFQLPFASAAGQRCIPMQKLIDHNSKSPDFCLWPIFVKQHSFGAHVDWTSNINILEGILGFNCKTEISDFGSAKLIQEDIGELEVSVDNSLLIQIHQAFVHVVHELRNVLFLKFFLPE